MGSAEPNRRRLEVMIVLHSHRKCRNNDYTETVQVCNAMWKGEISRQKRTEVQHSLDPDWKPETAAMTGEQLRKCHESNVSSAIIDRNSIVKMIRRKHFMNESVVINSSIEMSKIPHISFRFQSFLDASSHLYKRVCPSVRPSVRQSVGPSVGRSVTLS